MQAVVFSESRRHNAVILEDDPRTAVELRALLDASPDFVCGAASCTVDQAATQVRRNPPTVVLSDMRLQGVFRPDAIPDIKLDLNAKVSGLDSTVVANGPSVNFIIGDARTHEDSTYEPSNGYRVQPGDLTEFVNFSTRRLAGAPSTTSSPTPGAPVGVQLEGQRTGIPCGRAREVALARAIVASKMRLMARTPRRRSLRSGSKDPSGWGDRRPWNARREGCSRGIRGEEGSEGAFMTVRRLGSRGFPGENGERAGRPRAARVRREPGA